MSYDWGPHFIVPSESLKRFSGAVLLRESLNGELLQQELSALGFSGAIVKISNPWYYRKKGTDSWIKIGESDTEKWKELTNIPASAKGNLEPITIIFE